MVYPWFADEAEEVMMVGRWRWSSINSITGTGDETIVVAMGFWVLVMVEWIYFGLGLLRNINRGEKGRGGSGGRGK